MQGWDARPKARQIVGRALKSSWQIIRSMPLLLVGAIIAYALVSIATSEISNFLPASMADQAVRSPDNPGNLTYIDFVPLQMLLVLTVFVQAVALAPLEVATYRFILLGKLTLEPLSISLPYIRQCAAWTFALDLTMHLLGQAEFMPPPWSAFYGIPIVGLLIATIWISLLFPAIAIGVPTMGWRDRIQTAIHQAKGNFWLLLCSSGIILFPVFAATLILDLAVGGMENSKNFANWPYLACESLIVALFQVPWAAAVSWIYAWVTPSVFGPLRHANE